MVRGEEKQFEVTIERLLEYTKNIKISLLYFITRIEQEGEAMDWPQVLDSFTSICGQINTLMRFTREHKSQFIENRVVLPLLLSPDRDDELAKLTEGRVQIVNHEMVPDYLRTKPDPEIEEFEKLLQQKSNNITSDAATKQINAMNKLVENTINSIKTNSARIDSEMSRQTMKQSFVNNDTNELIMAVSNGKGLRMGLASGPNRGLSGSQGSDSLLGPKSHDQMLQQQLSQKQNVKAPELKTNIKPGP